MEGVFALPNGLLDGDPSSPTCAIALPIRRRRDRARPPRRRRRAAPAHSSRVARRPPPISERSAARLCRVLRPARAPQAHALVGAARHPRRVPAATGHKHGERLTNAAAPRRARRAATRRLAELRARRRRARPRLGPARVRARRDRRARAGVAEEADAARQSATDCGRSTACEPRQGRARSRRSSTRTASSGGPAPRLALREAERAADGPSRRRSRARRAGRSAAGASRSSCRTCARQICALRWRASRPSPDGSRRSRRRLEQYERLERKHGGTRRVRARARGALPRRARPLSGAGRGDRCGRRASWRMPRRQESSSRSKLSKARTTAAPKLARARPRRARAARDGRRRVRGRDLDPRGRASARRARTSSSS